MARSRGLNIDEIGYWSEIKLQIIRDYASAYSQILTKQQKAPLEHVYIDAFAGAGFHTKKGTGESVDGSPRIAISTSPAFLEFHFIDLDGDRIDNLRSEFVAYDNVYFYHGDCNTILTNEILPNLRYDQYRRGLCLLDPYGLHLDWNVIRMAGELKTVDVFLNFPVADINRNVFWTNPDGVSPNDIERMNRFWGDGSWRSVVYKPTLDLFEDDKEEKIKNSNKAISEAFRNRLKNEGGFEYVPEPIPMRNSKGAIVYYLYFASQKKVAEKIATAIFKKYRNQGVV